MLLKKDEFTWCFDVMWTISSWDRNGKYQAEVNMHWTWNVLGGMEMKMMHYLSTPLSQSALKTWLAFKTLWMPVLLGNCPRGEGVTYDVTSFTSHFVEDLHNLIADLVGYSSGGSIETGGIVVQKKAKLYILVLVFQSRLLGLDLQPVLSVSFTMKFLSRSEFLN